MGTTTTLSELYTYQPTDPDVVCEPDEALVTLRPGIVWVKRSAFEHVQSDETIEKQIMDGVDRYYETRWARNRPVQNPRLRGGKHLPMPEDIKVEAPEGVEFESYLRHLGKIAAWKFGFNVAIINPAEVGSDKAADKTIAGLPRGRDCLVALIGHGAATDVERYGAGRFEYGDRVYNDGRYELGRALSRLAIPLVHVFPADVQLANAAA